MDRFIVMSDTTQDNTDFDLKSNMDRFIAKAMSIASILKRTFKIQYG